MHEKIWHRPMGKMLSSLTIGILGAGKIGQSLIQLIKAISPSSRILFYDPYVETIPNATKSDLKSLISQSDLLSLHLPLNSDTKNLINEAFLEKMNLNRQQRMAMSQKSQRKEKVKEKSCKDEADHQLQHSATSRY